ncbi:MAG: hypothetical protein H7321_10070, partial [Bacteroidia bacterium]|nr:hypothetical protein [Bacteroidia bacterium]
MSENKPDLFATKTDSEMPFDFDKLWLIFKKSWYWFPILLTIAVVSCHYYIKYTKPVYRATSTIKLEVQKEASNLGISNIASLQSDNLSGEIELIRSKLVAQDVAGIVDLNISYYAVGNILTTELFGNSPFKINILSDPQFTPYDKDYQLIFTDNFAFTVFEKDSKEKDVSPHKVGDIINFGKFKFAVQ